jgi:putative aldouronate transport system permease protein
MKYRRRIGETVSRVLVILVTGASAFVAVYPLLYTLSMSLSRPMEVLNRTVWLLPKGFYLGAYRLVFQDPNLLLSYFNTIWYTVVGTSINLVMIMIAAYPLARGSFSLRRPVVTLIVITMFFSGGLIPLFILVSNIGLYDTRWSIVIPSAVSAWYIFVARTYLQTIPESLTEAAAIEGSNDIWILVRIVTPLSKPLIAVLILFCGVGHWNNYFWPMIFLQRSELYPMQIFLRRTLILLTQTQVRGIDFGLERSMALEQFKYASIIVTVAPILVAYPFLQKYFVQGVMIGALKA